MNNMPSRWDERNNSLLSLSDTLNAVNGTCLCSQEAKDVFCFTKVVTDSRNVEKNTLFIPLVGEKQDGHGYIVSSIKAGATVVFVEEESYKKKDIFSDTIITDYPLVTFVIVKNTLYALQNLARAYIKKFPNLKRIGITGSSGKTTTKELIGSILSQKYKVIMNEGNLNSETGLPLSVFKVKKEHQVGIFEMGMNRQGEIAELASVLDPHLGVITNIGTAHIGLLGSKKQIAKEKKQIFSNFTDKSVAFIPKLDEYSTFLAEDVKGSLVFYGPKEEKHQVLDLGLKGTEFFVDDLVIRLPLPGKGNYYDALAAVAVGKALGCSLQEIKKGIEEVKPLFGRSQIIEGEITVVQDCYNANPESVEQALDFFASISNPTEKKLPILGDMLELGQDSLVLHKEIIKKALEYNFKGLVLIGSEMARGFKDLSTEIKKDCTVMIYDSTEKGIIQAGEFAKNFLNNKGLVLLKGSRGMQLERITPLLSGGNI